MRNRDLFEIYRKNSAVKRENFHTLKDLSIAVFAVVLPFTPLAEVLGFVPLPFYYYVFLGAATVVYLGFVELVKRRLMKRLMQ